MRLAAAALAAVALWLPAAAAPADGTAILRVRDRWLPPLARSFSDTPDGWQARYDAARDLQEAVRHVGSVTVGCRPLRAALVEYAAAHVAYAEAFDRPLRLRPPRIPPAPRGGCATAPSGTGPLGRLPAAPALPDSWTRAALPATTDAALTARLERLGRGFRGWAGFWVHDLTTGRTAGWNADARFPAASTVKLGAIAAALARSAPDPATAPHAYDVREIAAWSSNLAANRIAARLGLDAVADGLRRLGMVSSTYPGLYRAGTATGVDAPKPPPLRTGRVTTARDLGRALFRLHAAAAGRPWALRRTGLSAREAAFGLDALLVSEGVGDNVGLLRGALPRVPLAQKHGWISDTRLTAGIVYRARGPVVVVVEAVAPGLSAAEARRLGAAVAKLVR